MAVMTLERALTMALELHRAGRLGEAEDAYQKILERLPLSHDALHGCGLIAQDSGKHERAVELISQAIAIRPEVAGYHANLGLALKELGKLSEAEAALRKALEIDPR